MLHMAGLDQEIPELLLPYITCCILIWKELRHSRVVGANGIRFQGWLNYVHFFKRDVIELNVCLCSKDGTITG